MRIFQTVISVKRYHEFDANADKDQLLEQLAKLCLDAACELLHLPAGFWIVRGVGEVDRPIQAARRIARHHGLAIVSGIDIPYSKRSKLGKTGRNGLLPSFGFAIDASGRCYGESGQWRQLSATRDDAKLASPIVARQRMLVVNDSRVAVVLCGEMHNPAIRRAIAEEKPNVILVSGHKGLGQGLVPTLRAFHRATVQVGRGVAVLHSQHLKGQGASLHMVDARGISRPIPVRPNIKVSSPLWAAATIRKT
jgi:hypothetical protein